MALVGYKIIITNSAPTYSPPTRRHAGGIIVNWYTDNTETQIWRTVWTGYRAQTLGVAKEQKEFDHQEGPFDTDKDMGANLFVADECSKQKYLIQVFCMPW